MDIYTHIDENEKGDETTSCRGFYYDETVKSESVNCNFFEFNMTPSYHNS